MAQRAKDRLLTAIEDWVNHEQLDDALDMYISDDLIQHMADAAWAVLRESRATQQWLKREGDRFGAFLAR